LTAVAVGRWCAHFILALIARIRSRRVTRSGHTTTPGSVPGKTRSTLTDTFDALLARRALLAARDTAFVDRRQRINTCSTESIAKVLLRARASKIAIRCRSTFFRIGTGCDQLRIAYRTAAHFRQGMLLERIRTCTDEFAVLFATDLIQGTVATGVRRRIARSFRWRRRHGSMRTRALLNDAAQSRV
jgi:hypothetical protein